MTNLALTKPIAAKQTAIAMLPPLLAFVYPWLLWIFFQSVTLARVADGGETVLPLLAAATAMILCAVPSVVSFLVIPRLPPPAQAIALLAFTTPALYTVERVLCKGLDFTGDERLPWAIFWAVLAVVAARRRAPAPSIKRLISWRWRAAHGISAAAILITFLVAHLTNHLLGLASVRVHVATMDLLRHWYRLPVVESLLMAAFFFQVLSGARMVAAMGTSARDPFRILQIATGVGLLAFLFAHLSAVFIIGRWQFQLDTNWAFATSFKPGLLGTVSNVRMIPYYWFAVFATLAHLACGLRIVLLAHGWRPILADRLTMAIIGAGVLLATLILIGMCGAHFSA